MITNRKAKYEFNILKEYTCGIILIGSEVKPLKANDASINQAYCYFKDSALYIKNMHIGEHKTARFDIHEPTRDRKLLLKKKELKDIEEQLKLNKAMTIVPLMVFEKINFIKITIGLAVGKKAVDKRNSIKDKDVKRDTDKQLMKYK